MQRTAFAAIGQKWQEAGQSTDPEQTKHGKPTHCFSVNICVVIQAAGTFRISCHADFALGRSSFWSAVGKRCCRLNESIRSACSDPHQHNSAGNGESGATSVALATLKRSFLHW